MTNDRIEHTPDMIFDRVLRHLIDRDFSQASIEAARAMFHQTTDDDINWQSGLLELVAPKEDKKKTTWPKPTVVEMDFRKFTPEELESLGFRTLSMGSNRFDKPWINVYGWKDDIADDGTIEYVLRHKRARRAPKSSLDHGMSFGAMCQHLLSVRSGYYCAERLPSGEWHWPVCGPASSYPTLRDAMFGFEPFVLEARKYKRSFPDGRARPLTPSELAELNEKMGFDE